MSQLLFTITFHGTLAEYDSYKEDDHSEASSVCHRCCLAQCLGRIGKHGLLYDRLQKLLQPVTEGYNWDIITPHVRGIIGIFSPEGVLMLPKGPRPPVYSPLGSIKTPSGLKMPMIPRTWGVIISHFALMLVVDQHYLATLRTEIQLLFNSCTWSLYVARFVGPRE